MRKGSPYLVDILRNVVASAYKYTMHTSVGIPVTFDFSSKDISKLSVHHDFSPSFLLKARMGLYDSKFSPGFTVMDWVGSCQRDNLRTWDIERILSNYAHFYDSDRAWANQFPLDLKKGFVEFVHRCLTEFKGAFDADILEAYRQARPSKEGVFLYEAVGELIRESAPRMNMAVFNWNELDPPSFIDDCHVDFGPVRDVFYSGDYRYEKYEPAVVEYLKKKLEME